MAAKYASLKILPHKKHLIHATCCEYNTVSKYAQLAHPL